MPKYRRSKKFDWPIARKRIVRPQDDFVSCCPATFPPPLRSVLASQKFLCNRISGRRPILRLSIMVKVDNEFSASADKALSHNRDSTRSVYGNLIFRYRNNCRHLFFASTLSHSDSRPLPGLASNYLENNNISCAFDRPDRALRVHVRVKGSKRRIDKVWPN